MKSTNTRRFAAIAAIAVALPLGFASTANADSQYYDTNVKGSFRDGEAFYKMSARGDIEGARGTWRIRTPDGFAEGRVLCVSGDKFGRNDGNAAELIIQIDRATPDSTFEGARVRHLVWDAPGRDKHSLQFVADDADCVDEDNLDKGDFVGGGPFTGTVRGDVDVRIRG